MHANQIADHYARERGQAGRAQAHAAWTSQQQLELEKRQRELEQRQKEAFLKNAAIMNPSLAASKQSATMASRHDRKPSPEEEETHVRRSQINKPAVVNIMRDFFEESPKVEEELVRTSNSFIRKPTPQVIHHVPAPQQLDDYSDDEELEEKQEAIRKQNEAIKSYLEKVRSKNSAQQQALKFQAEMDKLNALEAKLFDHNRHMESVKALTRLGDDMNRMARNQALASIKAGQARKDAETRALMQGLLDAKKEKKAGKDPWARKMLQALMDRQQPGGSQQFNPAMFAPPIMQSPQVERSIDSAEKRRQEKRIKKLNDELDRKNKMLDNLKQSQVQEKPKDEKDKGMMNKEEVAAAIEQALKKQADELDKKAKDAGAGPEDIVTLPNGVAMIRPKDKTKPPIFVMPDDSLQKLKEKMEKTKSSLSSSSSISESIPPKPNPIQQMMLGMLMSQNMRMMMGDDQSSAPSKKSRKSTSSSHSKLPPIIINPPPIYQPPPVQEPKKSLPKIDSAKPKKPKIPKTQSMTTLPVNSPNEPQPTPVQVQPQVLPPVRPPSVKSVSTDGQPVQPPVKANRLHDFNSWNIEPPKPSVPVDLSRSPSLKDNYAPPQSSFN